MANYREDIVNIDLECGNIHRSFLKKSIGEGDKKADRFGVRVFRNGEEVTLSGTCSGLFVRSDGGTVTVTDAAVSGNTAYVILPEACYAVEGYFCLAIKLTTANDITTLRIVDGVVSRTSTDKIVDPGTVMPSIEDLLDAIETAVESIPADYSSLWESLAQNFNASKEGGYKKGELVTYNGTVYIFKNNHSGNWSSSDVISTDLAAEIEKTRKAYQSLDYSYTTDVQSNDDMDDYTTPGNFRIATAAIARTIKNYPSILGGRLFVLTINGTNSVLHVVIDTEDRMYTRTKSASGWASWNMTQQDVNRLQKIGARSVHSALKPIMAAQTYNLAFANAPASIDMMNYIGNDQNVHPKVLYFADGFGGHKYWMAYTPYPLSYDKFENPCIAYSDDGYAWTNIEGNPIDDANGNGYNSDTHLVYNGSTLECWYRLVDDESASPRKETLKRRTSSDGLTWSNAETVLENSSGDYSKLLSPAVIYESGKYCMWVVNGSSSPVAIDYYESTSLPTWTKIRTITLSYTDGGTSLYPWHLDVIKENGQYILLVMGRNNTTKGSKWTLFLATSSDNATYTTPEVVMRGSAGWDEYMYRSSIVKVPGGYRIYYSAGGNGNIGSESIYNRAVWGIGISESETLEGFIGV